MIENFKNKEKKEIAKILQKLIENKFSSSLNLKSRQFSVKIDKKLIKGFKTPLIQMKKFKQKEK